MTVRDMQALEFLTDFKLSRVSTLTKLIYKNNRVAQRRLKILCEKDHKILRLNGSEYIYYTVIPKQFMHSLATSDYLGYLSIKHKLEHITANFVCGDLIADAFAIIDGHPTFIEVQLSNQPDLEKYLSLRASDAWKRLFDTFPTIRILSSIKPKKTYGLNVVVDNPKGYTFGVL